MINFKKASIIFLSIYIMSLPVLGYKIELVKYTEIIFVCFLATSFIYMLRIRLLSFPKYLVFLLLFLFLLSFSSLFSSDISYAFEIVKTLISLILLTFLISNVLSEEKDIALMMHSINWAGLIMSLYAVYFYKVDGILKTLISGGRLGTEINQINAFGLYSSLSFVTCVFLAVFYKKYIYILFSILPLVMVFTSASRRALIICLLSLLLFLVFKYGIAKIHKFIIMAVLLFISLQLLINSKISGEVGERLGGLFNFAKGNSDLVDSSSMLRYELIQFGIEKVKENFIFGKGTGSFRFLWEEKNGIQIASHNNYIELLVNNGFLGIFIYYGLFIYLAYLLLMRSIYRNTITLYFLVVLINTIFISGIAMITYYDKFTYIVLAVSFATIKVFSKKEQKRSNYAEVTHNVRFDDNRGGTKKFSRVP